MIVGHIFGLPVEESVLQLAGTGAVTVTVATIAGRNSLTRPRRRLLRRNSG